MATQTQRLPIDVIDLIVTAAIKYQVFQLAPGTVRPTRIITPAAPRVAARRGGGSSRSDFGSDACGANS